MKHLTLPCGHVVPGNDLRKDRCVHEWRARRERPVQLELGLL